MKDYDSFVHRLTKTKLSCGRSLDELASYDGLPLLLFANFRFHSFMSKLVDEKKDSARNTLMWVTYRTVEPILGFFISKFAEFALKLFRGNKKGDLYRERLPRILFTSESLEWRVVTDYKSGHLKKTDMFFDSIISESRQKFQYLGVYPIGLSTLSLRVFVDKLRKWEVPFRPFDLYWSLNSLREEATASRYFREVWKELNRDESFKKLCIYNGKDLYSKIGAELRFYLLVVFPRIVKRVEMARRMVRRERPDLILIEEEYGEFERTLAVAGRLEGSPTLGIQHGVIVPTHYGYMFEKEDRGKMILPDFTAVYGQYHYDLLTKHSIYKPEQVIVTGQPRYDILYHVDRFYSRQEFLEEHGINPTNKILLWTTQSHGLSDDENAVNFETVFETMQSIQNVVLIVKQHPGEGERYTEMIENCLRRYKVNALLTGKGSDTYEQIYVCDLLMTKTSTTAMEAVALNKPVIILNLSGEPDTADYVQQGVALGVYSRGELKTAIEKLLVGDLMLARNREQYVRNYLYKIDGKAAERVVNVIEKILLKEKS